MIAARNGDDGLNYDDSIATKLYSLSGDESPSNNAPLTFGEVPNSSVNLLLVIECPSPDPVGVFASHFANLFAKIGHDGRVAFSTIHSR